MKGWMRPSIVLVAVLVPVGCSGKPDPETPATTERKAQLREVYELLLLHEQQKKRPAGGVQDLRPYENAFPAGFATIRNGKVAVSWGAAVAGPEGVLAYEKKTPTEGRWVVLQGGQVKELSPDEFKAAPKAKK